MEKENIRIVIAHHTYTWSGVVEEDLLRYCQKRFSEVIYITHPFKQARDNVPHTSAIDIYTTKKKIEIIGWKGRGPEIFYFAKDILYTLWYLFRYEKKADIFFGVDNLNAFCGIILRGIGKVKRVVYYSIDLYPQRFSNHLLNDLYHFVDKFCVQYADETWNLSENMAKQRSQSNISQSSQYTVPVGIWKSKKYPRPNTKINSHMLIYAGSLVSEMGIELILSSVQNLIKKIPQLKVLIVGGGEKETYYKKYTVKEGLKKYVSFLPWQKNRDTFLKIISKGAVGLAPFNTEILDSKVFVADPGKIKDYMMVGMPVITTKALSYYKIIQKTHSGVVINYTKKDFIHAVIFLLSNKKIWQQYRENAYQFIQQFDYDTMYNRNFDRLLKKL